MREREVRGLTRSVVVSAALSLPLVTANNFAQVLDIEGDAPRNLVSVVAADGRFQFYLDGQPLAGSVVPRAECHAPDPRDRTTHQAAEP